MTTHFETLGDPSLGVDGVTLSGGTVLHPDGKLIEMDLHLSEGVVQDKAPSVARMFDVSGCLVLPGIVDAHGDGFERHLAPRRGALSDLGQGLSTLEQELFANGITTAMLAQFWSWEGGMRGPDFAQRLATALNDFRATADLHMLLRLELGCLQDVATISDFVVRHRIGHVVVSDHLPHKALAAGRRVPRLEGQALKSGRSPEEHQTLLETLYAGLPEARAKLPGFAEMLSAKGVRLGSHDDDTPETRAWFRDAGFGQAEFPLRADTAASAHMAGDFVVMGAPNVVRGGSHKRGGLAARDVVEARHCDALASDYHYPAPLAAVRRLEDEGWSLAQAWPLISSGPARGLGFHDRGEIAMGKRADLIVVPRDLSRVHGVFVAGKPVFADAALLGRVLT